MPPRNGGPGEAVAAATPGRNAGSACNSVATQPSPSPVCRECQERPAGEREAIARDRAHFDRANAKRSGPPLSMYRRRGVRGEFGRLWEVACDWLGDDFVVTVADADATYRTHQRFGYFELFAAPNAAAMSIGRTPPFFAVRYVTPVVVCSCNGEVRRFVRVAFNGSLARVENETCWGLFNFETALRLRPHAERDAIVSARIAARMAKP